MEFRIDSGLSSLKGPLNDIEGLSSILGDRLLGGFDVRALVNATSFEIKSTIDECLGSAGKGDLVLIYYSGHGKLDRFGSLCLATSDTRAGALQATSIPCRHLKEFVSSSDCSAVVLVLDCCYSGAATAETRGDIESQLISLESASGFYILTASSDIQTATEAEVDGVVLGRFTEALIEGIKSGNADFDCDGKIYLNDIFKYVKSRLRNQSPRIFSARAGGDPLISLTPLSARRHENATPLDSATTEQRARHVNGSGGASRDDLIPTSESDFRTFSLHMVEKFQHPDLVIDVQFNRAGTRIATVCNDGRVRVFDLRTFSLVRTLQSKPQTLRAASWGKSGNVIATSDSTGTTRLWRDGAEMARLSDAPGSLCCTQYGPSGQTLLVGSETGALSLWQPHKEKLIWKRYCHDGAVNSASFSDDGRYIVTASADGTAAVLSALDGSDVGRFSAHRSEVAGSFFISGAEAGFLRCVSAGMDGQICIWRVSDGESIEFITRHKFWVRALCYCPQGQFIFSGGYDASIKLIDLRSGNVFEATNVYGGAVLCLSVSDEGDKLVATTNDGGVFLMNLTCSEP